MKVLVEAENAGPGQFAPGIWVTADGVVVTSQSTLAARLDTSKAQINRALRHLQKEGRIALVTTSRETRIVITAMTGGTGNGTETGVRNG